MKYMKLKKFLSSKCVSKSPVSKQAQKGFTMMEILVAFMISLIGLQGLVAVQSLSLSTAQGSYYRAQAITLLNDIAGRMNANPSGVSSGEYDSFSTEQAPSLPDCYGSDAGCSTTELSDRDKNIWASNFVNVNSSEDFSAFLPNGIGTIDIQEDGSFRIEVSWDENQWSAEVGENNQREVVRVSVSRNINVLIPF